ncbi:unknown similar to AMEV048 [Choristoneura rosaceana entomopoxvirus 'L']|uniref:N1R/p28-like protein n=1 Tax=Choristoneura rosaceana entomopoxvirus 'L' TaxID=1293539 RepID=A0ABM9QK79_9POXV|nr:unknown similar to AMEV048 [Choristoneura rosaceana entomopoxvirus 'L']CCU55952.1 unknown similar to AMEV048 [Choristoneura rosaceana entomopoxvirus 'L']
MSDPIPDLTDIKQAIDDIKTQTDTIIDNLENLNLDSIEEKLNDLNTNINNINNNIINIINNAINNAIIELKKDYNVINDKLDNILETQDDTSVIDKLNELEDIISSLKDNYDGVNNNINDILNNLTDVSNAINALKTDNKLINDNLDRLLDANESLNRRITEIYDLIADTAVDNKDLINKINRLIDAMNNNNIELRDQLRIINIKLDKLLLNDPIDPPRPPSPGGCNYYVLLQNRNNRQEFKLIRRNDYLEKRSEWVEILEITNYGGEDLMAQLRIKVRNIIKRKINEIKNDISLPRDVKECRIQYLTENPPIKIINNLIILDPSLNSDYLIHIIKKIERENSSHLA